jgi:hypothetical protein
MLLFAVCLVSCSEDFKVGAPYKPVTIVYGLLSISDTAQYIKITRGFFDEKNDNVLSAKNADSLYHKNLKVTVEEYNQAGTLVNTFTCAKVNLADEGYAKDSGTFATSPSYAYKFKETLNKFYTYKMTITDNDNGKVITASTPIISKDATEFKTPLMTTGFGGLIVPFNFSKETSPVEIRWVPPANSGVVDVYMRLGFVEENTVTGTTIDRMVYLPLVRNSISPAGDTKSEFISRSGFIGLLTEQLGAAGGTVDVVKRYIDTPSVLYTAGGIRLKEFVEATRAQGGITSDEIRPTYRNGLTGDDVYGLYDSRVTRTINAVSFTKETVDSMIFSDAYRGLNIVGVSPK